MEDATPSSSDAKPPALDPSTNASSIVLALLVFSVFINYIDRGNLSIAAPLLKDELHLSGSQLGILLSSFFWTYGFFQFVSGWLADRFNANWVMAIGFLLWSAATSATGLLHGFTALLIVRLILGVGEAVAFPCYAKILANHCHPSRRGFANAAITTGLAMGPAFGMLLGGLLMARFGWRPFFIAVGLISLLWLPPWLRWMPRGPGLSPLKHLEQAPPTIEILKQRAAWGSFLGMFCNNYLMYFMIAWLPFYLVRERHFSMSGMAKIGGAVFLTQAIASALSGRIADRWIVAGGTRTRVHLTFMLAGVLSAGACLAAAPWVSPALCVGLLLLVGAGLGVSSASLGPIAQTLAGPRASGRWTGLQYAFANYSGAFASAVTGRILDRTGHFAGAFAVAAAFSLAGTLFWGFVVRRVEPVVWGRPPSVALGDAAATPV